eukprot:4217964-Alexandrium_andersonii.AAC.1
MAAREATPAGLTGFAQAEGTDRAVRPQVRGSRQVGGGSNPSSGLVRGAGSGRDKVDATVSGQ